MNAGSSWVTRAGLMCPGYGSTVGQTPPHTISMVASATSSAVRSHWSDFEFASSTSLRVTGTGAGIVTWGRPCAAVSSARIGAASVAPKLPRRKALLFMIARTTISPAAVTRKACNGNTGGRAKVVCYSPRRALLDHEGHEDTKSKTEDRRETAAHQRDGHRPAECWSRGSERHRLVEHRRRSGRDEVLSRGGHHAGERDASERGLDVPAGRSLADRHRQYDVLRL